MIVYEDSSSEQVRVFDRGVDVVEPQSFGEYQLSYRSGDVLTPFVEAGEPLSLELADFVDCVRHGTEPVSSSRVGLDVVRLVEAAETSLDYNASPVLFDVAPGERRTSGDRRRSQSGMPVVPWPGVVARP